MVSRSVVRPLNNNRRVKQDPELTRGGDPDAIKDQTFADGGKAPYIPASDDTYKGTSELRYSNGNIEQHPYIRQFPRTKKLPYKEVKNMEHIPPSKDKYPRVEDGPARNTRARKKMVFHADTTQDHFAYNVSLDSMDEKGNSYFWEVQDILGHKQKSD